MGRSSRINRPGLTYHVINRGNNRDVIFAEEEDFRHYLNCIQRYKKKYMFKLFAFCLMTNHVHLLIKVTEHGSISKIMQSITVAHTRYYNFKYQRCGHVWQGRFESPIVSDDHYLMNVMRYIEQNPVRAKMVSKIDQYPWNSYRLNTRQKDSVMIDREENLVYKRLGKEWPSRLTRYKKLVQTNLDDKIIKSIHASTRKGEHYISEKFKGQISFLLQHKRRRGRPRKIKS